MWFAARRLVYTRSERGSVNVCVRPGVGVNILNVNNGQHTRNGVHARNYDQRRVDGGELVHATREHETSPDST